MTTRDSHEVGRFLLGGAGRSNAGDEAIV